MNFSSGPSKSVVVDTKEEMPEGPPLEVTGAANGSQALAITWKVGVREANLICGCKRCIPGHSCTPIVKCDFFRQRVGIKVRTDRGRPAMQFLALR